MGNRREFLKVSLAASAGIAICGCSSNGSTAKIFDDSERNCLIAISEQIVPADEQWGGANIKTLFCDLRYLGAHVCAKSAESALNVSPKAFPASHGAPSGISAATVVLVLPRIPDNFSSMRDY